MSTLDGVTGFEGMWGQCHHGTGRGMAARSVSFPKAPRTADGRRISVDAYGDMVLICGRAMAHAMCGAPSTWVRP